MNVILTAAIAAVSASVLFAGVAYSGSPAQQTQASAAVPSRAGPWATDLAQDNATLVQHAMRAPVKQWWVAIGSHGACRPVQGSPFRQHIGDPTELFAAYAEDDGYTIVYKRANGDYIVYAGSEADCGAMTQGLVNQGI